MKKAFEVAEGLAAAVDFTRETGKIRPELHSSGWTPRSYPRDIQNDDEAVKSMNLAYARTHDWALVNSGQRVIDYQNIFPLIGKDATDPSNYYFAPSDHLLQLSRNVGLKTFYRLGTSIEHTGTVHFNALVPKDFDKVAEVFAGIIRHYNRGWADGKKWNIGYWEIWNEPDGTGNMWCEPGRTWMESTPENAEENWKYLRDKFIQFFVVVLKRLKAEFPEVKVGGPALCDFSPFKEQEHFRPLLQACKDAGVAPDFISWHYYGSDPGEMVRCAERARKMCDEFGFTKCELILDEWHYILSWDGIHGSNSTPAMVKRALEGPTGHNQIDSACFALSSLVKFQTSKLDQAYYYGCGHQGQWGYMDEYKQFNKPYFALKLFGGIVRDFPLMCVGVSAGDAVTTLAAKSADGKKLALLVVDYRGAGQVLKVAVQGAGKAKHVSAVILDDTHDNIPCDVAWRDGVLTLVKSDKNSSAWLVTFEL